MMSAELGRFLQRDPLGYVDGYNLYEYVDSRVFAFGDPFGLSKCKIIGFVDDEGWELIKVTMIIDSRVGSGRATHGAFGEEAEGEWRTEVKEGTGAAPGK